MYADAWVRRVLIASGQMGRQDFGINLLAFAYAFTLCFHFSVLTSLPSPDGCVLWCSVADPCHQGMRAVQFTCFLGSDWNDCNLNSWECEDRCSVQCHVEGPKLWKPGTASSRNCFYATHTSTAKWDHLQRSSPLLKEVAGH